MKTMQPAKTNASYGVAAEKHNILPDYKTTEIGVLPQGWKVESISSVADVKTGPFGSALHQSDYVDEGTPIITVEHLGAHCIIHDNLPLVSDTDRARLKSYTLKKGDIVFSRVGSVDRNSLVSEAEDGWLFSGRLLRIRTSSTSVYPSYLNYHFQSEPFKQRVREVAVGQTMASLNTQILNGVYTVLPPLPEQRAIAEALSDVDGLLRTLEKMIAKKRSIKQAAMQQLLIGKTRLPGFSGAWETKRLGELGYFLKGKGITRDKAQSGSLPCVRYGEIYTQHHDYIRTFHSWISAEVSILATRLEYGDILFAGSGETKEEIGKCVAFLDDREAYAGGDIIIFRPCDDVHALFFGYALNTPDVNRQKASFGQGDAVVHINATALAQIYLPMPRVEEQTAIASVLSDMDDEIEALERRWDKTHAIKQGMMQQLLTGRIRLI